MATKKIYCSLDIETSGFDPLKNEVLEVGLAFFNATDDGLKITKEYTKVFKPKGEVPSNILGLTGITQEELDKAKPFEKYKEELQENLKDAVIVGHNVIFDIKFLESLGIEFSGEIIDTLDLVQFILPTHHSYNLENIMHTFGIEHKEAHRALPDSKASVRVLERMLQIYCGFPEKLRQEITKLLKPYAVIYKPLLDLKLQPKILEYLASAPPIKSKEKSVKLQTGILYNLPLGRNFISELGEICYNQKQKILLVVPRQEQAVALWKKKIVYPVFGTEHQFSEKKFKAFCKKSDLSADELKFLLKVLVWKYTNWQNEYISDLNLSFFGGQYRDNISGGIRAVPATSGVVCCDHETFLKFSSKSPFKARLAVIVGLSDFESAISNTMGTKVSWSHILYILRSVYNPEINSGNNKHKKLIEDLLIASDLFFGLTHALLHTQSTNFQYCKITPALTDSDSYKKISSAAESYADKLHKANEVLALEEITKFTAKLKTFFEEDTNAIKWIELADKRCVFFSSPLEIEGLVKKALAPYDQVCFVDSLGLNILQLYFQKRLGLGHFKAQEVSTGSLPLSGRQIDLFSPPKNKVGISCSVGAKVISSRELSDLLSTHALPTAVLFGSALQVKQFYEERYRELQSQAFILAQNNTGGGNRLFRNFSIHDNSLLIATDKFILKYLQGASKPVEHLPVKTLILTHLPFEQFTHPYQETLSEQFENPFINFSLPKAVYNFHCLLDFFFTEQLENVYIFDPKLAKDYAKVFRDYLSLLPGVGLKS